MSERPDFTPPQDPARDPQLDRAYRESARDEPPARLDDAIRAAARREVGARPQAYGGGGLRAWRVPVSIAAMLVVGVSIVTLVREEHPEVLQASPPAPAAQAPSPLRDVAPERQQAAVDAAARHKDAVTSQASAQAVPEAKPDAAAKLREESKESSITQPKREERFNEQETSASAARNRTEPPLENARRAAPAAGISEAQTSEAAADHAVSAAPRPALRADSPVPATAAAPSAEGRMPSLAKAQAEGDYAGLDTPDKWLARIRERRKQGRLTEAAKVLAEFRQRHPGYVLPPDLADGIKP